MSDEKDLERWGQLQGAMRAMAGAHRGHNLASDFIDRRMIVNLPELTDNDVVDMIRGLSVITDAFVAHHQVHPLKRTAISRCANRFHRDA